MFNDVKYHEDEYQNEKIAIAAFLFRKTEDPVQKRHHDIKLQFYRDSPEAPVHGPGAELAHELRGVELKEAYLANNPENELINTVLPVCEVSSQIDTKKRDKCAHYQGWINS